MTGPAVAGPDETDAGATRYRCASAVVGGRVVGPIVIETDQAGRIARIIQEGAQGFASRPGEVLLGTVVPGMANAHSHAFHRLLRGRTHSGGGDFWRWRTRMYAAAAVLDADLYSELAVGVFGEMLAAGWTTVGEFHYVHHRPDGTPYDPPHAMELALARAATEVGIRLVLLDTLYLDGGVGEPLSLQQRRFGDADAHRWLTRWHSLRDALRGSFPHVSLGAAVHSVRAVPPAALAVVARALPADVPLHVHVSEQPRENEQVLARYGGTPTRLLADAGLLSPRLAAVHATHLTADDIALLGEAQASIVLCPTTEADLGDGIGPARRLADAGARIALGSDQHAVVDPFLEMRGLEAGERLAAGRRGRFSPEELLEAAGPSGSAALGLVGGLASGAWADLVEIDTRSVRTAGSDTAQLPMTATASDVQRVIVGGKVVTEGPAGSARAAANLIAAIAAVDSRSSDEGSRGR